MTTDIYKLLGVIGMGYLLFISVCLLILLLVLDYEM